jgi:hypothetical protein
MNPSPFSSRADCFTRHCETDEVSRSNLNDRLGTGSAIYSAMTKTATSSELVINYGDTYKMYMSP